MLGLFMEKSDRNFKIDLRETFSTPGQIPDFFSAFLIASFKMYKNLESQNSDDLKPQFSDQKSR